MVIAAAALALCALTVSPARAAIVNFAASLDGGQETPPNSSTGTGTGTFVMDTVANTLTISIMYSGLTSPTIAGHIHGFAPPGVASPIIFPFSNPNSPVNEVWNFSESDQPQIIAGLTYANIHTTMFPGGEIRGQILRVPSCGDGIVDAGEQCDDGNNVNGDCCDATCQFETAGSACGSTLCTGQCDGSGNCGIRTDCRGAAKGGLLLKNSMDDSKDKLVWKWLKGDATTLADLGTPTGTTAYALCIYSGTSGAAIAEADIPPSASLWTAAGTKGFKFKDPSGTPNGVQKALVKSGDAGKAKALVKGKGTNLPDPTMPLTLPITVQLVNSNNVCFETDFASFIKNDAGQFKAKTP